MEELTMKILFDEMYSGMKEYFEVMGFEVETLHELGISGLNDRELVEYVKKHNMLLITEDRKPAELAELIKANYFFVDMKSKAEMIRDKIIEKYPEIKK
ncbi:MAG: DUF5615 family PIN-like protein [Promethearchaeota archaeon]|jgi:predicted nuclease of predicted toxin-antitoxin system